MLWTSYSFSDIMGFPLLIGHLDLESRASKSAIAIPSWSLDYGCRAYAALTPIWQYLEMWLWNVIMCMFSHVQLFATPWTVAHQTLLSMGFSRQEYWSGFHFLLQGIFPIQGSNYISYVSCIGRWILYHCITLSSSCLETRKGVLTRVWACCTLVVDFLPPELWENKYLLFKDPSLWYLFLRSPSWIINYVHVF